MRKLVASAIVALCIVLPSQSRAQYVQNTPFNFQLTDQNMWGGSGNANWNWSQFVGVTWDKTMSLGGIAGSKQDCIDLLLGEICTDTRTGFKITAATNGSIGLNLGATASAGTVDVTMPGQATLSVASLNPAPGGVFTIGSSYSVDPSANIHTQFPSFSLFADLVFDVHASVKSEECFITLGCSTQGPANLINVSETPELVSLNRDDNGLLKVLGIEVPLSYSFGPVGVTASIPDLETSGSAPSATLSSSGEDPILSMDVDVPSTIADLIYPGAGYAFTGSIYGITYTTLGAALGPDFSIGQDFTFTSNPMATLAFSEPVSRVVPTVKQTCGWWGCISEAGLDTLPPALSWDIMLGSPSDFLFPDALTLGVTPTYWLSNSLRVNTDLLSRLALDVTALSLSTPIGGLGPLYEQTFQTDPVSIGLDDRTYSLAFGSYQGSAFELTATPEPSTWVLMGTGLLLLGLAGWHRRPWA